MLSIFKKYLESQTLCIIENKLLDLYYFII